MSNIYGLWKITRDYVDPSECYPWENMTYEESLVCVSLDKDTLEEKCRELNKEACPDMYYTNERFEELRVAWHMNVIGSKRCTSDTLYSGGKTEKELKEKYPDFDMEKFQAQRRLNHWRGDLYVVRQDVEMI